MIRLKILSVITITDLKEIEDWANKIYFWNEENFRIQTTKIGRRPFSYLNNALKYLKKKVCTETGKPVHLHNNTIKQRSFSDSVYAL